MGHSWQDDGRRENLRGWGLSLLIVVPFALAAVVVTVALFR